MAGLSLRGVDAEKSGLIDTVLQSEVAKDYGDGADPTYGVSGIDGITFDPAFATGSGNTLTVAYRIFRTTEAGVDDEQVLLQYDISGWSRYREPLHESDVTTNGAPAPEGKYSIITGNTHYGIQNLAYNPTRHLHLVSVYPASRRPGSTMCSPSPPRPGTPRPATAAHSYRCPPPPKRTPPAG